MIDLTSDHVQRFHKQYDVKTNGCWEWNGSTWKDRGGYGRFFIKRKGYRAHRISWLIHHKIWPGKKLVCHKCDNPPCVNPKHLFSGTVKDNSIDMVMKGRAPDQRGEKSSQARLTAEQVIEIREKVKNGGVQRQIAKQYGVSPATICCIVKRKKWKNI